MIDRYNECIDKLYSIAPSFQNVGSAAYHPGLKTMEDFAAEMGDPQKRFRSIHIAGTNGKGSTAHFLASALAFLHPGARIGLYTSPHLVDFRERVRVITVDGVTGQSPIVPKEEADIESSIIPKEEVSAGNTIVIKDGSLEEKCREHGCPAVQMISREEVVAFMDRYEAFIDGRRPSFFEITTAMAFEHFAAVGVEFAVIETGLGGRLDSTNIIPSDLSIITSVGLDHVNILGSTIGQIAREKAGIIKPGKPVVVGQLLPEALEVVREVAGSLGAPLYDSTEVLTRSRTRNSSNSTEAYSPELPEIPDVYSYDADSFDLKSDSQRINFRTVLTALGVLGYDLAARSESVMYALRNAARISGLRGRWERISEHPRAICDIGHNPEAMRISMTQLRREAMEMAHAERTIPVTRATQATHAAQIAGTSVGEDAERLSRSEDYGLSHSPRIYMVYGMVADKDVATVADLLPADATYIFTQPHGPRALAADALADIVLGSIRRRTAIESADSLLVVVGKQACDTVHSSLQEECSEVLGTIATLENYSAPEHDAYRIVPEPAEAHYIVPEPAETHYIVAEPAEAYRLALRLAAPEDLIFVGGSSFVVSEVLADR